MKKSTLEETLKWSADNGVDLSFADEDGKLVVAAKRGRISARYQVAEPTPAFVGNAIWSALYAVMCGTEFHAANEHGPRIRIDASKTRLGDI